MGKKDMSVNRWLSDKERFADLFNGSLFEGRQFIDPQKLTRLPIEQKRIINTIEGKKIPVEYFRDIIMFSEQDKKLCILACETQNKEHYAMVIRGMLYDSLSYMEQVQNIAKENREKPEFGRVFIWNKERGYIGADNNHSIILRRRVERKQRLIWTAGIG